MLAALALTQWFYSRVQAKGLDAWVKVSLAGMNDTKSSNNWHVHEFPVVDGDCDATGGHYTPSGTLAGELATNSGKTISDGLNAFVVKPGGGLSLFGRDSVVGRSIVVHLNSGRVCGNIVAPGELTTVKATFAGPDLFGFVVLQQPAHDPTAPTTIFSSLRSSSPSANHSWHIHEEPVGVDGSAGNSGDNYATRCASTGGHWNPTSASTCGASAYDEYSSCEVSFLFMLFYFICFG